jgi:putative heme iron utilization protein
MSDLRPQPGANPATLAREADVALAQRLLAEARMVRLATALPGARPEERGWPYASLVLIACDADGRPILLLSDLAEHTKNIRADPRVSLLIDGAGAPGNPDDDPLAAPRVTLLGRAQPIEDAAQRTTLRTLFLARHPEAAVYADFTDFHFYRVIVERAHLVAGFGRIRWIRAKAFIGA